MADVRKDTGFAVVGPRGCEPNFAATSIPLSHCIFGDRHGTKTLVLVGDSHSSMWLPAFDQIGLRLGWKVILLNKVNCGAAALFPYLAQESRPYKECVAWHTWVLGQLSRLRPQLVVFTSEVREFRLAGGGKNSPATWQDGLSKTLAAVASPGTKKVVLGDIPYIWPGSYGAGPNCLATHARGLQACSAPKQTAVLTRFQEAERAAAHANATRYIDATPWFCGDRCWSVINNIQVYSDWQHITATYARYLSGSVQEALAPELAG